MIKNNRIILIIVMGALLTGIGCSGDLSGTKPQDLMKLRDVHLNTYYNDQDE
jgi:hypothetical protein